MCGISGFLAFQSVDIQECVRMNDFIRHRGPDDEGFVSFPFPAGDTLVYGGMDTPIETYQSGTHYAPTAEVSSATGSRAALVMGHRRLSIVDLSPLAHQPMCTSDRRYWIVYNGEVYNHIELRSELEQLGHQFISHSDTEVILCAYKEWGQQCLHKFNGMFALLIYDRETNMLFAARDRFGVKPFYYWVSENGIGFASEIKQFNALDGWSARVNGQRAYDFLNWGITDHTDETLFSGVYQLRAGHAMQVDAGRICSSDSPVEAGKRLASYQWYQIQEQPFSGDRQQAALEFREKLIDSVRLRLRADVPVGSCLSGGLDSSSIVCVANQLLREKGAHDLQKTFSARAEVSKYDESKWIDIVVNATKVEAHFVCPPLSGLFDDNARITWHQDEPFGSTSIYAQWKVFALAAEQNTKVMLDGQGADEQLAGYHGFFGPHLVSLLGAGKIIALINEMGAMQRLHGYGYARSMTYLAGALLPVWLKDVLRKLTGRTSEQAAWLDADRLKCKELYPFKSSGSQMTQSIHALSKSQLTASNLQMLLHWEDRDSMAHSVESRVPFLDYRLVEFVVGLPDEFKLSDGITKRVLREGMSGVLPDAIRDRMDKKGFETPEEVWMRQTAPDLFRQKLADAIKVSNGIVRHDEATRLLEEMISGQRPFSFLPWRMISFGEWIKEFNVVV